MLLTLDGIAVSLVTEFTMTDPLSAKTLLRWVKKGIATQQWGHSSLKTCLLVFIKAYHLFILIQTLSILHTVSFDWFLSCLEWIYLEFCYWNFCCFTSKYCRISDLDLTFPHFEFSSLYLDMFDKNLHFLCKKLQFWSNTSIHRLKNSKCGRVKPDLIFYNNFW